MTRSRSGAASDQQGAQEGSKRAHLEAQQLCPTSAELETSVTTQRRGNLYEEKAIFIEAAAPGCVPGALF